MIQIRDYCTQDIVKLRSSHCIADVLQAFLHNRIDIACILDESDHLIGIMSKNALYRALLQGADLRTPIGPFIRHQVVTFHADDSLDKVRNIMQEHRVAHGVICDHTGQIMGVIAKSDIIRGFLHEKELLANQLSNLIEHLQDVVISINAEGRIVTFNRAAENMFHKKKEQIIGEPIEKWFPELSAGLISTLQKKISKDPLRIPIGKNTVIASFIHISNQNNIDGAMAFLQDVTALEAIATELESTKNLQHTIQHALTLSYDAIIIIDSKGQITNVNEAFLELFELDQVDLLHSHWSETVPELELDTVMAGHSVKRTIRTIRDNICLVYQEPIVRSGHYLGAITKIIFRQLDEWRDVFLRLDQLENEINYYRRKEWHRAARQSSAFDLIIGRNAQLEKLKGQALLASKSNSTVLIMGESGTGKELFAEAIHIESKRSGSFVKVNCAAIPSELLESEFFGYAEGAFTGARKGGKQGKFELADQGTLFLDEIGDMPLSLQAKLLRVLQEQTFERIGDVKTRKVDVRIIAATNKNLKQMVEQGTFREDLYYRIDVVTLSIPPLRERLEDLSMLCDYLIKQLNRKLNKNVIGITPEAMVAMQGYTWPGNVRQLENVLERSMNMEVSRWIEPHHLPEQIAASSPYVPVPEKNQKHFRSFEEMEKQMLMNTLERTNNNRSETARLLGISRSSLYQKLRKYGIEQEVRFLLKDHRDMK